MAITINNSTSVNARRGFDPCPPKRIAKNAIILAFQKRNLERSQYQFRTVKTTILMNQNSLPSKNRGGLVFFCIFAVLAYDLLDFMIGNERRPAACCRR